MIQMTFKELRSEFCKQKGWNFFEFTHKRVYDCERCGFDFKMHCDVYIDETIICKTCAENLKGNFINGGITK